MATPSDFLAQAFIKGSASGFNPSGLYRVQGGVAGAVAATFRGHPVQVVPRGSNQVVTAMQCDLVLIAHEDPTSTSALSDAYAALIDALPTVLAETWWTGLASVLAIESEGHPAVESFEVLSFGVVRADVRVTVFLSP